MDTLIVFIVGLYLFVESFTAINEMPQIKLKCFYKELTNLYTMKYLCVGLYGLLIMYHAAHINGWAIFLIIPAIFCVLKRTIYRWQYYQEPLLLQLINNRKYRKAHK